MDWLSEVAAREGWQDWVIPRIKEEADELGVKLELRPPEGVCIVGLVDVEACEPLNLSQGHPTRWAALRLLDRERQRQKAQAAAEARSRQTAEEIRRRFDEREEPPADPSTPVS